MHEAIVHRQGAMRGISGERSTLWNGDAGRTDAAYRWGDVERARQSRLVEYRVKGGISHQKKEPRTYAPLSFDEVKHEEGARRRTLSARATKFFRIRHRSAALTGCTALASHPCYARRGPRRAGKRRAVCPLFVQHQCRYTRPSLSRRKEGGSAVCAEGVVCARRARGT